MVEEVLAVFDEVVVVGFVAVPFEHGEFGIVGWAADFAVSKDFGDLENFGEAGTGEEAFHLEFGGVV